ncbi:guanylate-binding protein 1-like [Denticeps clupeoides]|nr:guanylate-binding protein 1-like [Denticeps clupeoides]
MDAPVCLIESDSSDRMCVRREAVEILDSITQPVVVVAVVGLYRTGKSYLMNRLAGKQTGFALGSTIESKTKGIWMWCVPHPTKPGHTLVLLDTEGLGDVDKGDEKHDTWIFCLAVLLSSTLVYNSMGTIDNNALEKLHYVTELTEHIKVKSGSGDDDDDDESMEFMRIFPTFVWTVRDFTLLLELDGRPITSDQYLDHALQLKKGSSPKIEKYNLPRRCLRHYFAVRKCFVFERPASGQNMRQMEQLSDSDLEPNFTAQAQAFCSYIFDHAKAKTMKGGLQLTGRMLGCLAETYVEAIRSGQVPCLDNAVESLAQIQNARAVHDALTFYVGEMTRQVKLPTATQDVLSEIHAIAEKQAVAMFMRASFHDQNQKHQTELMGTLYREYEKLCRQNEDTSRKVSRETISRVFGALEQAVKGGTFTRPGGYNDYRTAVEKATGEYRSDKGCGLMSEEVLREYLSEKEAVAKNLLAADKSLTKAEQMMAEERMRTEALEQQQRALEEQNHIQQKQIEDQKRTHDENVKQIMEKMEQERVRAQEENEKVLNAKLKEQQDLLQQGFQKKSQDMQDEINKLKNDQKQMEASRPSIFSSILDTVGTAATVFLPGWGKLAGIGASALSRMV